MVSKGSADEHGAIIKLLFCWFNKKEPISKLLYTQLHNTFQLSSLIKLHFAMLKKIYVYQSRSKFQLIFFIGNDALRFKHMLHDAFSLVRARYIICS